MRLVATLLGVSILMIIGRANAQEPDEGSGDGLTPPYDTYVEISDRTKSVYEALDQNPEIAAARAELRAAEARVRQLEMKTATEIVRKQGEIDELTSRIDAQRKLVDKQLATADSLVPLMAELEARKSELAFLGGINRATAKGTETAESYIKYFADIHTLLNDPILGPRLAGRLNEPRPSLDEGTPEILRKLLNNPISILFEDTALREVVDFITGAYEMNINVDLAVREIPIEINLKNVSIEHAFLALADTYDLVFVMRDYGVFITTAERARTIAGPTIPEGVPYSSAPSNTPSIYIPVNKREVMERMKYDATPRERRIEEERRFKYDALRPTPSSQDSPQSKPEGDPSPSAQP